MKHIHIFESFSTIQDRNKLRFFASNMTCNSFLDKFVGEYLPIHHELLKKPNFTGYHDTVIPEELEPSEYDDWSELNNTESKNSKNYIDALLNDIKRGENIKPILVSGLINSNASSSTVIDGHHRLVAHMRANKKIMIIYDIKTLSLIWKNENNSDIKTSILIDNYYKYLRIKK